jgi:hypothetical protein
MVGNLAFSKRACNANLSVPGSGCASAWRVARHSLAALWTGCYDRGTAWRAMTVQGDEGRELIHRLFSKQGYRIQRLKSSVGVLV